METNIEPYYNKDGIKIYLGDCRDILPHIDLSKVDTIITDPPYSSGGYQEAGKSNGSIGTRDTEIIAFDNLSTRGYEKLLSSTLRYCNQIDEIYLFTDWRMWIYAYDLIEGAGWRVRNMLVWNKLRFGMGMPWRNQHELIVYGKKSPTKIVSGNKGNVLNFKRSGNKNHPTEKPEQLIKDLIQNSCNGNFIIDPFMGSGTTLCVAKQLGKKAIGIELNKGFCDVAIKRLSQQTLSNLSATPLTLPTAIPTGHLICVKEENQE